MKLFPKTFLFSLLVAFSPSAFPSEMVAEIAKQVTVRIEGATQGSGVVVEKNGDEYTVLTAWHVLRSNNSGEEISIFTPDGQNHITKMKTAIQVQGLDLAKITFQSSNTYSIARQGDASTVSSGGRIFVAGFPLPSTAVPVSIYRFLAGQVIANALGSNIPKGYELLYDNLTLPGMSGGPVLNSEGQLVGIHGQGEIDIQRTEQEGVAVKTGTNQAIPINYWHENTGMNANNYVNKIDSMLAKAMHLADIKGPTGGGTMSYTFPFNGYEDEIIELTSSVIEIDPKNLLAYNLRALARKRKPSEQGLELARVYAKSTKILE